MGWAKDDFLRTASEEWWQSPHLDCDSPRHHLAVGESAFERTARLWDWESLETLEVAQHAELEGTSVRWCNVPPAAARTVITTKVNALLSFTQSFNTNKRTENLNSQEQTLNTHINTHTQNPYTYTFTTFTHYSGIVAHLPRYSTTTIYQKKVAHILLKETHVRRQTYIQEAKEATFLAHHGTHTDTILTCDGGDWEQTPSHTHTHTHTHTRCGKREREGYNPEM